MSKAKEVSATTAFDALVAAGLARDVAVARLGVLKEKYGALKIPIQEIINLLEERITPEIIKRLVGQAASDLAMLLSTGKSKVERDDSAMA